MRGLVYRMAPVATSRLPTGIPFIIANEGAERFSFYGMRAILVVFMTQYLLGPAGTPDTMGQAEAMGSFCLAYSAGFIFPSIWGLLRRCWRHPG
jgi:POT family proton-dependent oligopeptide transporter